MSISLNIRSRITLQDGNSRPLFGLGVRTAQPGKETYDATVYALNTGYRHIDAAELYGNEKDVGNAIIDSGLSREEIFVTTKLGDNGLGYDHVLNTFDTSLKKMNLEYVDLYMIHWPTKESQVDTWRVLERIKKVRTKPFY